MSFKTAEPSSTRRLAQVVYTATAVKGVERVRILGKTYTREDFGARAVHRAQAAGPQAARAHGRKAVQTKLAALGYLPAGAVSGTFDYRTQQAVLAFQAWTGCSATASSGPLTLAQAPGRRPPAAAGHARAGSRVEIYRARGVVLLIDGGRSCARSTPRPASAATARTSARRPAASRSTARSCAPGRSRTSPGCPYAAYWVGGWALHGYADVPARPASHGCARLPMPEAKIVYDFVSIGTPVRVI